MRSSPRLHIVLFQPEIPQNTGNIGRTCVALEAKLWLVRPLGFQLDTQRLRRAGLDYWDHLDWEAADNWEKLTERLPTERMWYFTRWGTTLYTSVSYTPGDVLVFGSESAGLPTTVLATVPEDRRLKIPTSDKVRSLNLSNAVAIAAYEAHRQSP